MLDDRPILAGGDAATARQRWEDAGGSIVGWHPADALPVVDVHVDALYGTGLNRAPGDVAATLIKALNASHVPVLALDVPSGLNADTGHAPGVAVRATVTVSFIVAKRGLYTGQAADYVGQLECDALDLPETLVSEVPDAKLLNAGSLPPRLRVAHKGNYGRVLAMGGDDGMAGAIRLCAEAALRSGAGLVSVATHRAHRMSLVGACPELMTPNIDDVQTLHSTLNNADVLALGPGLGTQAWGRALWLAAMDADKPLVLDADALNLLAQQPRRLTLDAVLAPHPGEAARLLQTTIDQVQADRFSAVRALAERYHAVVVLKGSGSLVADHHGTVAVCPWGNPGMASAGMGDLLTGVIAALMAQGSPSWQAACLGVGLHARAGDRAGSEGERGLLASDLLPYLRVLGNGLINKR